MSCLAPKTNTTLFIRCIPINTKTKGKYEVIVDRKKAIEKAIAMANKRDLVILAGKGHEPYQEINKEKYPFDERVIVKEIINNMK